MADARIQVVDRAGDSALILMIRCERIGEAGGISPPGAKNCSVPLPVKVSAGVGAVAVPMLVEVARMPWLINVPPVFDAPPEETQSPLARSSL